MTPKPTIKWRGAFDNSELNALHAEAFEHRILEEDWWGQVNCHSLGWVCAYNAEKLIGFVNIAWDGGVHAFLLDTIVNAEFRHEGIAMAIVEEAVRQTKASGCEWLHVDFEPHLRDFYFVSCGLPANRCRTNRASLEYEK